VLASTGRVPLWAAAAASVAGAIAGDCAGYVVGRRYGEKAIRRRLGKKWNRAHSWLSKNGILPIFLARFVPFVRTVLPITAGAIEVPRRRFFLPDIAAGIVWGIGSTLLGYFAGRDLEKALALGNRVSIWLAILVAVAMGFWVWRKRLPTGRARAKK
jgi:membrane protein DedA with SNARE-associated domain